jgi:signal transduction histidine kinase
MTPRTLGLGDPLLAMSASLDVDEVLDAVREAAAGIAGAAAVELWSPEDGPAADPLVEEAARTRRPLHDDGVHVVPIAHQDTLLGILTCRGDGPGLAAFLDHAAIALRNAKLFTDDHRREREVTAAYELARRLSTRLDVAQILDEVVDGVVEALACDGAASYRWNDARGGLVYVRGRNHDEAMVAQLVLAPGQGVAGRAYAERRAISTRDRVRDAAVRYPDEVRGLFTRAARFRAYLAVPIVFRDEVVGVLAAHYLDPHEFTPREIDVVTNLAALAATAIENARLYEEGEARRRAAEAMAELTRGLTQSLEPDVLNRQILTSINALFGTTYASLVRVDPVTGDQTIVALSSDGRATVSPGTTFLRHTGLVGRAVLERRPVFSPNAARDDRIVMTSEQQVLIESIGRKAMLAVPLVLKDEVIGGLLVADVEGRVFREDEVYLAQRFADQAALALHNAEILEELTARQERLEALLDVNRQLSRIQSVETLLNTLAEGCGRLIDADSVGFRMIEGDQMVLMGSWGDSGRVTVRRSFHIGEALSGTIAATGEPLNVKDSMDDLRPEHRETLERIRCRAWLGVPIKLGDRVVGVLGNRTQRAEGFSDGDMRIAAAFASQAAIALENARLYADTEQRRETAERLAAELEARNAELASFAYALSHDLKSPLVSLQGMSGLLEADFGRELGEQGAHYLRRIRTTVDRMERLVGDVLTLARSARGDHVPDTVALDEVVDGVLLELAGHVRARGVTVTRGQLGTVHAARTEIEQIFSNLIGNAVKYLGGVAAPAVEIGRVDRDEWVEWFVRDNGIGIDPAFHATIFKPFQRLQDVQVEGTGLGLAIVKKIVESAGGRVRVESAPGQGATFFFSWSCRDHPA